ncbi:MAG: AAA family ATPase [Azonexus sp.]|nr:AAA family ATPase [Azonexus sp.]MCK6411782.1 AAA family ATPase [Azonexus sp.]
MIDSLTIRNFRLFDELEIPKLGQVNLIVGKNNSGKSSLLEALSIFASQGNPATLSTLLGQHDENLRFDNPLANSDIGALESSFRHFFPKRTFPERDGAPIYIGDKNKDYFVQIEHRLFQEAFEEIQDEDGDIVRRLKRIPVEKDSPDLFSDQISPNQALHISTKHRSFWLDIDDSSHIRRRSRFGGGEPGAIPYVYVPTDFVTPEQLAGMWDKAALTEAENYLLQALQIIEEDVTGLAFVSKDEGALSREAKRVAIVKLKDEPSPIPLAGMGDGMTRVLQIVLSLFSAKGGILLLDEFENGLHYSVQKQAWDLVLFLAKELSVQVFATTHSRDCIEAFSAASIEDTKIDGMLFRFGKSVAANDRGRVFATVFTEERLGRLTEANIEVR